MTNQRPLTLPARRETAAYLLEKAAQCRRLEAELVEDPTGEALIKLAEEFERRAVSYQDDRNDT